MLVKKAARAAILETITQIAPVLEASGARSEELATLAPEAVSALREAGLFRLKLAAAYGGFEADPVSEILALESLAYHDFTSAWCTMVGTTAVSSLGAFLPPTGLAEVFYKGRVPTAAISFFPAGRAVRVNGGFKLSGRWRFNSGIRHSEWLVGGTVVENSEQANGGKPLVMFSVVPTTALTLHDNWRDVVGLKGTGSIDVSVENYELTEHMTFVWDLLDPKPLRPDPTILFPPFSYVAKEHAAVALGAARRALDELVKIATSTRGTFRSSSLDARQIVHREISTADLKIRSALALLMNRYDSLFEKVEAGQKITHAEIADTRAISVHATDVAIGVATMAFHFAGNTGLRHPHILGRLIRDLNTAGLHQVMSDTAYESHGKFRLGLTADPLA
ncbi:MAG TPA: acyl-CoA dehydrogenase family protein [Steroidobacteraceae bacterium]